MVRFQLRSHNVVVEQVPEGTPSRGGSSPLLFKYYKNMKYLLILLITLFACSEEDRNIHYEVKQDDLDSRYLVRVETTDTGLKTKYIRPENFTIKEQRIFDSLLIK